MDEPYRIEVLHIVNPHLIFVECKQKGEPVIQQVGIYGVLPLYTTIDIDGVITAERCENWPVAANTILREFFAELKSHVYFVPIHVDERSTIFDENVHQFGDIIIKHKTRMSITNHLIELDVAVRDEPIFHQKLASGCLKLKLNTARTEEVLRAIEKYYKKQRRVDHDWEQTIKKQTSLHQESKKLTALTEENLKLLERSSRENDAKHIMKTIERKEKDFSLCKDADLVSVGCGSRRNNSRVASATSKLIVDNEYKPQNMYNDLKQFLVTHAKKKDFNNDSSERKSKEIVKKAINGNENESEMKINDSMDSDDEWDCIDSNSKTEHSEELEKNERLHKNTHREDQREIFKSQQNPSPDEQCNSQKQKEISHKILSSSKTTNVPEKTERLESPKQNMNISELNKDKVMRHSPRNKAYERRLVYCPDMEMNHTNLKNLVSITVTEDSAANYYNAVEVGSNKTICDDSQNSNVFKNIVKDNPTSDAVYSNGCNKVAKDTHSFTESPPSGVKVAAKVNAVRNSGSILNSSVLAGKLQVLKNSRKSVENDSISSSSNENYNGKSVDGVVAALSNSLNKNADETETNAVPHSETKHIKNSSMRANRTLSNSILRKKLQVLNDIQKQKENDSSTTDTSVKDTSSSTEISKFCHDEPDQAEIKPEPVKVEIPKFANFEKVERNVNPFKNLDASKSIFVDKLVAPILMVHTKNNNLILPQCEIRDVPFKPDIRMMLKSMHIQKPKTLQTVTWTCILRGYSMFIIGPAGNGKTIGYVPALCNLVVDSTAKSEGVGPICIIVCATALSVSEVESYCKRFLSVDERIVTFFPGIDPNNTTTALLNGCHVLISTAPALVTLLDTDFGVDLRRLSTLVLDDCERLSQVYTTELARIIKNVKVMLKNRADKAFKVQYIIASRQWCDFMTPLAKKSPDTIIAIGASQECVLYSKTKTSVNFVKSQANKVNTVLEFLGEIDRAKRTVIVCREDEEVIQLETTLTSEKYIVIACNSTMTLHELCKLNETWANYEEPVLGPVLICCDGNLTHMNITNANYLVHFSMPPLFSMFCKRFSVLNENYASIFGPERDDVKIKILLDETNVEQLPKILQFVKRCTKEAFPDLDDILQEVLKAKDLKKAEQLKPMCNNLLMIGECVDMWNCSDRHTVFKEFDEPKEWMPKHGLVTFKITFYDSAVTYSARVLANVSKSGHVKYPNNFNTLSMKMGMYYSKEINRKLHGIPKVGDVCAVALKPNFFERCRVLKVIPSGTANNNHVLINLIDEEQMTVVSDVLLYYLPGDFKAIETYVVKVRLANIQPKDRDVTFSLAAKEHLQQITDRDREHGLYMRGQVVMALGNTLFVDTAEACVDLSSLSETVVKREFKKELLDRHADPNPQHMEKLKKISGDINTFYKDELKVTSKRQKCPEWAQLDKNDFSPVHFAAVIDADTVFLRLVQFQKVADSMVKDVKEYVDTVPEIDQEEIYVGNIVLAEFPDDGTYERARIDEIVNDKIVKCLFVDNGDWRQVSVNKLKPITYSIMHRIPFQAIECRLVGVKPPGNADTWPEFSTCWLEDNCFEDKEGKQKLLFVKYFTKHAPTVTGGHKYGVVCLDTYSEDDVVINKMMIELNLAKVIEDEEKYINEPFDLKHMKLTGSSSNVSEDVAEKDNFITDSEKPVTKDLVPLQPKESEASENNNIPLQILLGKPIRSVPLINSDNESDTSDKWDVNVDKDFIRMFGLPSHANITENNNTDEDSDIELQKTKTANKSGRDVRNSDFDTNKKTKESSFKSSVSSTNATKTNITLKSQTMSSEDDIDYSNKRTMALNIFRRKISKENVTDVSKKDVKNDTLDSDDLSSVATDTSIKITTEPVDPPRKPKLVWRQSKNIVAMKIILIGVEGYTLEIKERHIQFQTMHNDTNYEFEFDFYGVIVPEKCEHSNKGQYIQVRLVKMLARNWLSLTKDFSSKKWIVYNVDALEFTSDTEDNAGDEARKVIKHNYDKVDSSSEDEDFADDANLKYMKR